MTTYPISSPQPFRQKPKGWRGVRKMVETPQNATGQVEPVGQTRPARQLDIRCWRATIYPSEGFIWNGWIRRWRTKKEAEEFRAEIDRVIDDENVLVKEPEDFRAGIMWDAWLHVKECGVCQQLNGVTQEEARVAVKEIREEWEAYMGVNPEVGA